MADFSIRVEGDPGIVLESIGNGVTTSLARTVLKAANYAGGAIAETVNRTFPNGHGGLAGSFLPAALVVTKDKDSVAAGALSDLPQAGILNRGGTIRPKTVKMLAVPLTDFAKNQWPRDLPDDFLAYVKTKRNTHLLIEADSKRLVVHYVLKAEIEITPRYYIEEAAEVSNAKVVSVLEKDLGKMIDEKVGGK